MERFNIHIALVDDSHAILMMLAANLKELGYNNISVFISAAAVIESMQIKKTHYDVIFTDLNMPDIDGMGLIRCLGQQNYQGGIIIVSEMDPRVISLACELAKAQMTHLIGNLSKPITLDGLLYELDKLHTFLRKGTHSTLALTEDELIDAITENQITPHYQPKIDSKTNRVSSIEVLARIVRPQDSFPIPPSAFIPTAEKYDLINLLTFQLFEKSSADHQRLVETLDHDFKTAINLSSTQLTDLDCPDKLETILDVYNMKPDQVILEITEEHALANDKQLETLNRLRLRGFGVSLDDFGTGFTNLNQLRTLPFTEIKIDRSLICELHNDLFSQTIVNALVSLTNKQNIDLVAEGIETFEELEFLQSYNKNILLQGYLISKPKPITELLQWHRHWIKSVIE
ncbi:EAL domain-containing response regulator [Pseudoalteromonas denitrificans]|uniref:EAL domain, c-di-GMP-specific phosphodiesterase class I (Or its enzymatically inactive variant) n=1 Tax=Pseudoalteromonas denitrificans DSM 6059 TaxID=1123010 RepID=A0A1I1QE62_9GAMM|nr:EAL domain-containing response regulator [Pseudoalteromonas denitrificans]SFD20297.1 EAL domain, c-di-GMP-specific phosphodiesterase class I (or its enzymatically inactive variant) [Pseudoalteromonas denitrificans DSM 6059]